MSKAVTRLFTQFQPEHYDLHLEPDGDVMNFTGNVTIKGKKVGRPSQRITLHQKGLKISEATIIRHDKKGDQEFPVERINLQNSFDEVRLHANQMLYPGQYSISLKFEGKIHEVMHGIYPCNYIENGKRKKLIATQLESHHAREAFPCVDEPEAKATFQLALVTPKDDAAISNTPAMKEEIIESKGKTKLKKTIFETTPRMSTYLLAFVYGDMQYKEARTKNGVKVRVWSTKAQKSESLDFPLEVGVKTIEFFDKYYGYPYPLAKCDHVALPDFSAAAMENWGIITYREAYLLVDPKTTSQTMKELIATVISHEMSHQWFGNLVTMKWWDDLWLNESFANVMEYVATDAMFPEWHVWNMFVSREGLAALRRDSIAGVQSVKTAVNHPDEISSLFDPSIVYAKGGRLLNMLMNYIGEDTFRKGLTLYFEKHAYGNTTRNDLWNALSQVSGRDISAFMDPWLERPGFPLITIDQHNTLVSIKQEHFLVDPNQADIERIWPVPLLSPRPEIPKLLDAKSDDVTLDDESFVRLDAGAVGHYLVRYMQQNHAEFIASEAGAKRLSPAERLMLLSDSSLVARSGLASFLETLMLLKHYDDEDSEPVWDILALILADARRFIDLDETLETAIKTFVRGFIQKEYTRLGFDERMDDSGDDKKLRATIVGLGVYAKHDEILKQSLTSFEAFKNDESAVPSEIRSIVLGAAVRNNIDGAFAYLLNLEETTNNLDLKLELMGALSLTKAKDEVTQLLGRIKDSKKVRAHDVDTWLIYLLRNRESRRQAWDWLRDNWPWIEKTFKGDKGYDIFPRYSASAFNTKEYFAEYKAFFGPKSKDVALTRNIALGIEEIAARVTWLERDLKNIQSFFKKV